MLVSIIVPVYNCEIYLEKCLKSLINQTYKNIEIILINDGSIDNSLNICKNYALTDNRIKMISKENQGANIARHNGIEIANGEYCLFVDADDWIELNAVEILVKELENKAFDIIKFNGITEPDKKLKNNYNFENISKKEMTKSELYELLLNSKILNNMCFSIYKTQYLKQLDVSKAKVSNCEDFLNNLEIYTKVKDVLFIDNVLYHYRLNIYSTTKNTNKERLKENTRDLVYVYNQLFKFSNIWGVTSKKNNELIAFNVLDMIKSSLFSLFKAKDITKNEFIEFTKEMSEQKYLENIYNNLKFSDFKKIIKNKPLSYKLKHYVNLKNLYKNNYQLLWLNNYIYKFIGMFRR